MPHPAVLNPPSMMFDNPASPSSSSFQVEDFFNLDLLVGNDDACSSSSALSTNNTNGSASSNKKSSSFASSSSASSDTGSDSPAGSFSHLQTPPQSEALTSFDLGMGMNFDSSSFGGLPPIEEESIFTVGANSGASDFFKPGTDPLAGLSHSAFDLFAPFDAQLNGINNKNNGATSSSDNNNSSSATSTITPSSASSATFSFSAIDPQLTRTPATPATTDDHSENGADQDSDDESSHKLVIAPVKVGGKGKARRGTLHSGGVSKKPALSGPQSIFGSLSNEGPSAPVGKGFGMGKPSSRERTLKGLDQDEDDKEEDPDDWRPSPEEYAKMSSKEKRQLRNKISARNFRIRRKEYIATLEGDIADRDRVIEAIRAELGSTKSENSALRQEVATLKKAILEGRASPMLPPPAPLSPLSPLSSFSSLPGSSSSSGASSSAKSNNIIKPNTHKDLPTSPRVGASPFWGGQAGGFGSLGGGVTPVHTAIIPETGASVFGSEDRQKENINPALNVPAQYQPQQHQVLSQVLAQLYGNGSNNTQKNDVHAAPNPFDSFGFADANPFTLKTLDAYRMQLWGRAAAQVQQTQRDHMRSAYTQNASPASGYPSPSHSSPAHSPNANANTALSGLASSLRPQYFASTNTRTSPSSPTNTAAKPFGSLLSNKGVPYGHSTNHHGLPTPPASPRLGEKDRSTSSSSASASQQQQIRRAMQQKEREQHALLASLASHTLLQKLGSCFWEAFSFTPGTKNWDSEKVRKVLDGSAVLKVVDVDRSSPASPPTSAVSSNANADSLAEGMGKLSLDNANRQQERQSGSEKKGFFARVNGCSGCRSRKCDGS